MLFNTVKFILFFIILFFLYYGVPGKFQKVVLLAANCYFYLSWGPKMIIPLLGITGISFGVAICIEKFSCWKTKLLVANIVVCIGILFLFKYLNFFNETINAIVDVLGLPLNDLPLMNFIMPIGISFWIFQTLGYVIDVYKGKYKAEKNFILYVLFVSYFPIISSGPIERAERLMPQLKAVHKPLYDNFSYGLQKMALGFFKKIVIADTYAYYVDAVFSNLQSYDGSGLTLILTSFLYTFQIYCDFSGYSDIAIGCSRMLGIELRENFSSPYLARTIKEFWRRWHISLSSWLTDYVYISLGGNRVKYLRYLCNLMITFLISGLWHGANWTYVIWGAYHGTLMVVHAICNKYSKSELCIKPTLLRVVNMFKVLVTFVLVNIGWIIFRASSINEAWWFIINMFDFSQQPIRGVFEGLSISYIAMLILPLVILAAIDIINYCCNDVLQFVRKQKKCVRWIIYIVLVLIIYLYLPVTSEQKQFIYFQF